MATLRRWRATLGPIAGDYPLLGERAHNVYNGLSGNLTMFATPDPALTVLEAKIQAFEKAQQAISTRTKGVVETRNLRAGELITCLESERAYVQELADASQPDQAKLIILTAGMLLWQPPAFVKPILQAVQSKPGAPVRVIANVGALTTDTTGTVFFNWQYTTDGKTWLNLPSTNKGHTEVSGLTPLVTYTFRASVTDSEGTGEWSQYATVFVL